MPKSKSCAIPKKIKEISFKINGAKENSTRFQHSFKWVVRDQGLLDIKYFFRKIINPEYSPGYSGENIKKSQHQDWK